MNDSTSRPNANEPARLSSRRKRQIASRRSIACVAACATMVLIGCDGQDDATIGVQTAPPTADATTAPAPSSSLSPSSGAPSSSGPVADETPDDPQAAIDEAYRKFSACMRDNGYPDFEDLTSDVFIGATSQEEGAKIFTEEMLRRGVDLADPATGPAMEACQPFLDEAASMAPEVPGVDEQAQQELILAFAECMRSQGVEDWPDPDFAANPPTGYSLEQIQSFDYQDPAIRAAGQYCDPNGEVLALFGR